MTGAKLTLCRRCASALIKPQSRFAQRRPFFTTRSSTQIPVLKIPAPQTTAPPAPPPPPPPIRHDPGLELGQNGIPVPPPPGERRRGSQEERAWTETVFRTLSGGMKSEYLKCKFQCGGIVDGVGTELDENGNVRVGMQAFKKMELCTMVPNTLLSD